MNGLEDCRVFVTGGTGFIGSHLVAALLREGAEISVLVRSSANLGRLEPYRDRLSLVEGDICQPDSLVSGQAFNPEVVFHLAAYGVERPLDSVSDAVNVNVRGTTNLLSLFSGKLGARLRAFVYTGTDFEYGIGSGLRTECDELRPPNYYAASKSAGWLFCRAFTEIYQIPVVGVRPFLTYGPNQGERRLVPYVILSALDGQDIKLTGGDQVRDFIYVDDVAQGILCAAKIPDAVGEMFNLGTGIGVSLRTIVQRIIELTGSSSRPLFGAIPYRKGEIWDLRADASKSLRVLGWSAKTTLDFGLEQAIEWYRKRLTGLEQR
jgi:nucleoside-diphosphate-sugar epimerase